MIARALTMKNAFVAIAILSVAVASPASSKSKDLNDVPCSNFDPKKLSLREVGDRNTLVSDQAP